MVGGVAFTVSLVSTTPDLVSEISFVVSSIINGVVLGCSGVDALGAPVAARSVTLQEEIAGECFVIHWTLANPNSLGPEPIQISEIFGLVKATAATCVIVISTPF